MSPDVAEADYDQRLEAYAAKIERFKYAARIVVADEWASDDALCEIMADSSDEAVEIRDLLVNLYLTCLDIVDLPPEVKKATRLIEDDVYSYCYKYIDDESVYEEAVRLAHRA